MTTNQGGSRKRLRKTVGFAAILIGFFVSMFGLGADLVDASTKVPNPEPFSGNVSCASLGFAYEFKINNQPTNGVYAANTPGVEIKGAVPAGTTITISNVESPNGRLEFDWASTAAWGAVLVKQADGGLKYLYVPAATDDQNVQTVAGPNQGGISHVSFCGPGVPPPTTGSLSIDKAVDGNDPQDPALQFTFTVECLSQAVPVDLNGADPGTTATVTITAGAAPSVLANIPTDSSCTVTETNAQGADATSMSVNGGAPTAGTTVSGIVIGNATTVAVLATNTFNTAPPPPPPPPPAGGGGPVVVNPPVTPPEVLPEVITPPVVTPPVVEPEVITPPAPPTEVGGVVVPRQLPRTGTTTMPLLQIGFGLMLLGAGLLLFGRERTVLV